MPVIDITKDPEALTLTVTAEFAADPERVWRLYEDPRLLERWWGPPGYPATFVRHELTPGGGSHYFMEGPDGTRHYGLWRVVSVDAAREFVINDAFADEAGVPNEKFGWNTMTVELEPATLDGGVDGTLTRTISTFGSPEQLEEMLAMGMEEGLRQAMNQIDAILPELTTA